MSHIYDQHVQHLREMTRDDVNEYEFNVGIHLLTETALIDYTEILRAKAQAAFEAVEKGDVKAKELMLDLKNDIDSHY